MATGNSTEWLSGNSNRAYPLAENSSRKDTTGNVVLPNSLLVGAQINAARLHADGVFFLSGVLVSPDVVTLIISFLSAAGQAREIARVPVVVVAHVENKSYAFVGQGNDAAVLGSLSIGNLAETLASVPASISFTPSAALFEINVVSISVPALQYIELYSGTDLVATFNDILKLRAGSNIRLTYVGSDTIRIDAIQGENLVTPDACANATPIPPCIRTINGIAGDANNNFQLEGSPCIDIEPQGAGLSFTDLCAQSCCGCTELEILVSSLQQLNTQIIALNSQVSSVNEQQATLIANLVSNLH